MPSDPLVALANNLPLAPRYHDHGLTGNCSDPRDCHLKPDLLLATCLT
ncbi:MAG: type II toxin-antitoxin system YafQ family toxin [Polaromonas sp.]